MALKDPDLQFPVSAEDIDALIRQRVKGSLKARPLHCFMPRAVPRRCLSPPVSGSCTVFPWRATALTCTP